MNKATEWTSLCGCIDLCKYSVCRSCFWNYSS